MADSEVSQEIVMLILEHLEILELEGCPLKMPSEIIPRTYQIVEEPKALDESATIHWLTASAMALSGITHEHRRG